MSDKSKRPPTVVFGVAMLAASVAPFCAAAVNPFAANPLVNGYGQVNKQNVGDDAKSMEGFCGNHEGKPKPEQCEGKCGEDKASMKSCQCKNAEDKGGTQKSATEKSAEEGKCGEGKCGSS